MRSDLEDIAAGIRALPGLKHLGLTSNGIVLARKLPGLQRAGVDKLNISLDTLLAPKFELLTRRRGLERVLDSIDAAVALGFDPVKVNCVVMRGVNDDEIPDFVVRFPGRLETPAQAVPGQLRARAPRLRPPSALPSRLRH